jgi:hypothetical protein
VSEDPPQDLDKNCIETVPQLIGRSEPTFECKR